MTGERSTVATTARSAVTPKDTLLGTITQWAVISAAGKVLLASFEHDVAADWARLAPNGATLHERTVTFTEWTPST